MTMGKLSNPFHFSRPGLSSVGPEHAWLKDTGRVEYVNITDTEALEGFHA